MLALVASNGLAAFSCPIPRMFFACAAVRDSASTKSLSTLFSSALSPSCASLTAASKLARSELLSSFLPNASLILSLSVLVFWLSFLEGALSFFAAPFLGANAFGRGASSCLDSNALSLSASCPFSWSASSISLDSIPLPVSSLVIFWTKSLNLVLDRLPAL